ncbi:hypothetical protein Desor_1234 [Desulfosporosinus orientis DSM 765]|uniref:Uncharacterized protein n=1 Tax=Desulfosporosinus orientis (strain ATCC 19365 / DSM 765 / NCIMB 8382 / VKM B-1628 / Singapore I) TaxID=768706 RepID=G7WEK7_DESOD|nr:hypothetical protein [Desulfosporosinus orientis]AET66898.1 hypothetical protein Desor_1234 [Desulfosporosinus orientis DSM 765]
MLIIAAVICYLSSLLFYAMGYLKVLVLNAGHVTAYHSTIYVAQAMSYFVITIFLALLGSLLFYVKITKNKERKVMTPNLDINCPDETDVRRRVS